MINYLAALGWNDGTDQEIYDEAEIIEAFGLDRVVKSSAVFDMTKLKWINGQHIRIQDNAALQPMIATILEDSGICTSTPTPELTEAAVAVSVQSMELLTDSEGIVKRCLGYPLEETIGSGEADKLMGDDFLVLAKELVERYDAGGMPIFGGGGADASDSFNAAWSDFVKDLGKALDRKGKRLFHPVRLAVTGSMSGPDVAAQMRLLGHAGAAGEGAVVDVMPITARMDTLRAFVDAFYVPPDPNAPVVEEVAEVDAPKKGKGKKGKKGAESDEDDGAAVVLKDGEVPTVCEFAKMDIRVGELVEVWNHPESTKLYCEKIDVGDPTGPREVCSGLAPYFTLEEMKNQRVLVVCNLKPAKMAGFVSNGMVLCAKSEDESRVEFMEPPEGVPVGTRVLPEIMDGGIEPLGPNQVKKKKVWEGISPDLTNNEASEAMWAGRRLMADGQPCKAKSITGGTIG